MIEKHIFCDECIATFGIHHELDETVYEIEHCPFCGGINIEIEEDYNNE